MKRKAKRMERLVFLFGFSKNVERQKFAGYTFGERIHV